jgi:hypothetical protein
MKMRLSIGVDAQLARVEAQLASFACQLDSLLPEIVHLQALGKAQVRAGVPAMRSRLKLEAQQMANFNPAQAAEQSISAHTSPSQPPVTPNAPDAPTQTVPHPCAPSGSESSHGC